MTIPIKQSHWTLLAVLLIVYLTVAIGMPLPDGMTMTTGDEPHYLLHAHSLYHDRDAELWNNYDQRDYRPFYEGEVLEPHMLAYKGRGVPLRPLLGMPLIILPAYALGGRIGVLVFLLLLVALGVLALYDASLHYASPGVAFWGTLFLGLTYPLITYSHQIYSETIAFVITSGVLAAILSVDASNHRAKSLIVGLLLGALLHFHLKLLNFSVVSV